MSRTTVKVAPPPMPADPTVCRWCSGRKRAFLPGMPLDICNASCAPNDQMPFLGHCQECGRDFETGRHHAAVCFECEAIVGERPLQKPSKHGEWIGKDYSDYYRRKAR